MAFSGGAAAFRRRHAGLNVGIGSDDDADRVAENRRRATEAVLPGARLVTLYQIHSADVVRALTGFDDRPPGDALVTDRPAWRSAS